MTGYGGRLEGIHGGRVTGWVVDRGDPGRKPNVMVLVNGRVVAVARTDRLRPDLAGLGDGAHGFDIDLAPHLGPPGARTEIDVLVGPEGWPLPGTPLHAHSPAAGVPAAGLIAAWRDGQIAGWAHGEDLAQTRLEVLRNGRLLFAWPCDEPREDLARANMGDGCFGFSIPISRMCGGDLDGLSFRLEGTDILLEPPRPEHSSLPPVSPAPPGQRFADAAEARASLMAALEAPDAPARSGRVRLSFAALQVLLDELSFLENRLADEERCDGLLREAAAEPLADAAPAPGEPARPAAELRLACEAIAADAAGLDGTALKARIEAELLPLYARNREARRELDGILRGGVPDMLEPLVDLFLEKNYFSLPAAGLAARLRRMPDLCGAGVLPLRLVESWAGCIDFGRIPEARAPVRPARPPRTLYVVWSALPYETNGYTVRTHNLLRAFRRTGAPVVGLTRLGYPWDSNQNPTPARDMVETFDDVLYLHLGGPRANCRVIPLQAYVHECAWRIAHVAALVGADVIHATSNWMVGLPALIAARLSGRPFCYEMRGLWEITRASTHPGYELSEHYDLFRAMEARTAGAADRVLAITPQVRDDIAGRGVDRAKIGLAPNGVDTERFRPIPKDRELAARLGLGDEFVFGFVGSFAPYEGLLDLCAAALRLKERGVAFRLLLVGDGAVFGEVGAFCAQNGLGDRVILTGRVPFDAVPRYYSLLDVALCPRSPVPVAELVSPLKPFEAMAMGRPVIASDVAALAAVIQDGRTGWLFAKGDVEALSAVMEDAVARRASLGAMGHAARRFVVKHHDWDAIAAGVAGAWDGLRGKFYFV